MDEIPEAEVAAAERYLTYLRDVGDPAHRDLSVEEVDEPLTAEEIADAEAGWRECQEGKARPVEEVFHALIDSRND